MRTDEERHDTQDGTILRGLDFDDGWTSRNLNEGVPPVDGTMYVYFIADEYRHVKIGISKRIACRFIDLQCMIPQELTLIGACHGGRELEKALHSKFDKEHRRGEWFRLSARLKRHIESLCPGFIPRRPARRDYGMGTWGTYRDCTRVNVPAKSHRIRKAAGAA